MGTSLREVKKQQTRQAILARAFELFGAEGYETVTMAAIAAAAQVGERTVYRYFGDKEEILFAEDDQIRAALSTAIESQPPEASATAVLRAAAHSVAALLEHQRSELRHRAAIIEATPALRARDRVKQAGHQQLISEHLTRRGLGAEHSRLAGAVGVVCFNEGLTRWLTATEGSSLSDQIEAAFGELRQLTPDT
ncbi:MAG TPA: TetR/AcrR family transcriptional regulator [Pseudonocardia sp.]|nr:TetR/AcrR family transcriptional regulator [Pseudonocardia sp.]